MIAAAFATCRLALSDSLTMDEAAHIPAGYSYLKNLNGRLNPEHPPLTKLLAAIGIARFDLKLTDDLLNKKDIDQFDYQYRVGSRVLDGSYTYVRRIVFYSRLGPIFLTLLLAVCTYRLGVFLYGRWPAVLPALFVLASPSILAHGHYVTNDVAAALGCTFSILTFLKYLRAPTRGRLLLAAVGLGIAQLAKFSALILLPLFVIVAVVAVVTSFSEARKIVRDLGVLFLIAYLGIVYPVYALLCWRYPRDLQVSDTQLHLRTVQEGFRVPVLGCRLLRCLADLDIKLAETVPTRPLALYGLGVTLSLDRSSKGTPAYFMGFTTDQGSPWYFPATYLLKETVGGLAYVLLGLLLLARIRVSSLEQRLSYLTVALFLALYWASSIMSPLNIGVRHLLPTFPIIYLLAGKGWSNLRPSQIWAVTLIGIAALCETGLTYPHWLSFCNQVSGGSASCYRLITDSNYDWGQDLGRLREWYAGHQNGTIAVDYFGGDSVGRMIPGAPIGWWSARGDPRALNIRYFAVSVQSLQAGMQPSRVSRSDQDSYLWLSRLRGCRPPDCGRPGEAPAPDFRAGQSIFIYDLSREFAK